ncbi:MAG: hypothetical protein H7287_10670 [Thermoleophilia bacterium]|nr:hypothetical protein [Thermoleophilia bacterium]
MQLASTSTLAAPVPPFAAFVSQLQGASNPLGGDAETSADCGVAASLMALWSTGAAPRPTTAQGIDQAFVSARLLATERIDRTEPLFPKDIDRLFTQVKVPHAMVQSGTSLLDDVRRGATAVVLGSATGATPQGATGNADGAGTWYERAAQLGLPGVPDGHAVTITGYQASDDSFTVMDPLAQAPFRAPAREVSTFIDNLKSWGYPAGVTVSPTPER